MRIGVTVDFRTSLFSSGISQNAIYLVKLYQNMGWDAWLITNNIPEDSEDGKLAIEKELAAVGLTDMPMCTSNDSINKKWDVILFLGLALPTVFGKAFRKKNPKVKFVSYKCGNEFFTLSEIVLFGAHEGRHKTNTLPYDNIQPDVIWSIPQMEHTNLDYYKYTQRQDNATVVPFVWSPMCIEAYMKTLKLDTWQPSDKHRIAVCESNVNMQKHLIYPIVIVDKYLSNGGKLDGLHAYSSSKLAESKDLISFIKSGHPDLFHNVKALQRKRLPLLLGRESDIVLSWQMENNLNYLYLDAAWLGYPVVHNANLCQDVGYYYEANQVDQAVDQLNYAFENHSHDYMPAQREIISRYLPENKELQEQYRKLTEDLVAGKFTRQRYDWKTNSVSDR